MEELVSFDFVADVILFDLNRKFINNKSERKQIGNLASFLFLKSQVSCVLSVLQQDRFRVLFWSIRLILCSWSYLVRSWFSELERKAKPAPCSFSRSSDANGSHHLHRQLADKKNLHQNARIQKSTSRTAESIASSPNSRRRKKSLFSHSQTDIIPAVFPRPIHVGCLRDPVPGTPKSNKRPWLIGRPTSSVFSGTRMKLFFCACNLKCLAFCTAKPRCDVH